MEFLILKVLAANASLTLWFLVDCLKTIINTIGLEGLII